MFERRHYPPRFCRVDGFTLIELLVAIMILTLFMTASMGAVRIAGKSMSSSVARADASEEMRAVTDFLRRQFAQLPPLRVGEGNEQRLAFSAESRSLRFVAPAPQISTGAGLMTYTLASEEHNGREHLILSYAPFDPGALTFDVPARDNAVVLAAAFPSLSFEYFGMEMDDDKHAPRWLPAWREDAERYPTAIRIRTRSGSGSDGWPELLFRIRLGDGS